MSEPFLPTSYSPQDLQLALISQASFNNFDGGLVVKDLLDNRHLWKACLMTRLNSLIQLRDLEHSWNVDTLYILVKDDADTHRKLEELTARWDADVRGWLDDDERGRQLGSWPAQDHVFYLWWD